MKLKQKLRREVVKIEIATLLFHEINQEVESQRFQLQQANRSADQAQRDKISLCAELELRIRLFQEDHARDCQETEELRRSCCEGADRARQARSDELSLQQERNPTTVSQWLTLIRESQIKVSSVSDATEFHDPESGSSSGATHIARTLPRCDSGLPRDTLNGKGITGNVFERPPAPEGLSSTILNSSKNLASSSQRLRLDITETARREK